MNRIKFDCRKIFLVTAIALGIGGSVCCMNKNSRDNKQVEKQQSKLANELQKLRNYDKKYYFELSSYYLEGLKVSEECKSYIKKNHKELLDSSNYEQLVNIFYNNVMILRI